MKAITLHQPHASLVALGVKPIETRSWSTSYRGPLAIHASKKRPGHCSMVGAWQVLDQADGVIRLVGPPLYDLGVMPVVMLGAVVATCTLVDVVPTELIRWGEADGWRDGRTTLVLPERQRPYGDYSPGRFAWLLTDVRPLAEPIPAKGRQGLWRLDPDLAEAVAAALDATAV